MITNARMKKFTVDNRIDKDGHPDPIIQLQVEMKFQEHLARELAHMTNGEQIVLQMEPQQREIDYDDTAAAGGSAGAPVDPDQMSLLPAGTDVEDAAAEDPDPDDPFDLANTDTVDLIARYDEIGRVMSQTDVDDPAYDDLEFEADAITKELYGRGLNSKVNAKGETVWHDQDGTVVAADGAGADREPASTGTEG